MNEPYLLFGLAVLTAPEALVDAEITFAELTSALEGRFTGRSLFNFLMADSDPTRAFSATALTRQQQIKRTVDPTRFWSATARWWRHEQRTQWLNRPDDRTDSGCWRYGRAHPGRCRRPRGPARVVGAGGPKSRL